MQPLAMGNDGWKKAETVVFVDNWVATGLSIFSPVAYWRVLLSFFCPGPFCMPLPLQEEQCIQVAAREPSTAPDIRAMQSIRAIGLIVTSIIIAPLSTLEYSLVGCLGGIA